MHLIQVDLSLSKLVQQIILELHVDDIMISIPWFEITSYLKVITIENNN